MVGRDIYYICVSIYIHKTWISHSIILQSQSVYTLNRLVLRWISTRIYIYENLWYSFCLNRNFLESLVLGSANNKQTFLSRYKCKLFTYHFRLCLNGIVFIYIVKRNVLNSSTYISLSMYFECKKNWKLSVFFSENNEFYIF